MADAIEEVVLGEQIARRTQREVEVRDHGRLWWCPYCDRSHQTELFVTCQTEGCGTEFDPASETAVRTVVTTEPVRRTRKARPVKGTITISDGRTVEIDYDDSNMDEMEEIEKKIREAGDAPPEEQAKETSKEDGVVDPPASDAPDGTAEDKGKSEKGVAAFPCPYCADAGTERVYKTELGLENHVKAKHS